jgi:hypothetical protein
MSNTMNSCEGLDIHYHKNHTSSKQNRWSTYDNVRLNKDVDIQLNTHETFLEKPVPGTIIVKRLENN